MTWIRLNTHLDGTGLEYYLEARRMGLRIFSIIHLKDLESAGWEAAFDRLYAMYPSDMWEIAGEISNPDPNVNPVTVTPAYYMSKFKDLYRYVKSRYPSVVLTSAPTYGSGSTGSEELEEFFKLGLLDMDVVVAINVYSNHALSRYATVIDRYADTIGGKTPLGHRDRQLQSRQPPGLGSGVLSSSSQYGPSRNDLLVRDVGWRRRGTRQRFRPAGSSRVQSSP